MMNLPGLMSFPRSITISVVFLALFLIGASRFLISYPITSTIHEYAVSFDSSIGENLFNSTAGEVHQNDQIAPSAVDLATTQSPLSQLELNGSSFTNRKDQMEIANAPSPNESKVEMDEKSRLSENLNEVLKVSEPPEGIDAVDQGTDVNASTSFYTPFSAAPPSNGLHGNPENNVSGACDLYHGKWVYDPSGPLYTNKSCPIITQMQNCQGNGRPDRAYENWRWKPDLCHLPRFDPRKFLQLMKGKTLAFIGDSVARNQMESMLCILWQVETPKNRGNRHMQRWIFPSTSTAIARIWSSWLVHHDKNHTGGVATGIEKLHLDIPDEFFMDHIPKFDVIVLSSGHWFAKQSLYLLNNTVVGWQLWRPPATIPLKMTVNNMEAYKISVETALSAMAAHPNYTGLTIVRSYSPDHYEGGAWNTGGSCTGKSEPAMQVVRNGFTDEMHKRQVTSFWRAVEKTGHASKFRLMDITESFGFRHDGHPGPYRSPDPSKITQRGPDGKPPSQDCLHWCMPGPVDTWNELVYEIIRREFDRDLTGG